MAKNIIKEQAHLRTNSKTILTIKLLKYIYNHAKPSLKQRNHNLPQSRNCTRTSTRVFFLPYSLITLPQLQEYKVQFNTG